MCVILFSIGGHPRYPLVIAANRDESYSRPAGPAAFWPDHPDVFGGRDLSLGGTWLALARNGRFAAITNFRQGLPKHVYPRSRGELTRDFLTGSSSPERYVEEVHARREEYGGYSLILGTPQKLFFASNRDGAPRAIEAGVHGLSNRALDEPWPKVRRGIETLTRLSDADEPELLSGLFEVLADRSTAPDHLLPSTGIPRERERDLSALFIPGESYGTRASTVVLVRDDGDVMFSERSFGPRGQALGETQQRFTLTTAVSLAR